MNASQNCDQMLYQCFCQHWSSSKEQDALQLRMSNGKINIKLHEEEKAATENQPFEPVQVGMSTIFHVTTLMAAQTLSQGLSFNRQGLRPVSSLVGTENLGTRLITISIKDNIKKNFPTNSFRRKIE